MFASSAEASVRQISTLRFYLSHVQTLAIVSNTPLGADLLWLPLQVGVVKYVLFLFCLESSQLNIWSFNDNRWLE